MQSAKDLLDDLNDLQVQIIGTWKREVKSAYALEYTFNRLQMLLDFQKQIAKDLMDMNYPIEELNLFVPMDEALV